MVAPTVVYIHSYTDCTQNDNNLIVKSTRKIFFSNWVKISFRYRADNFLRFENFLGDNLIIARHTFIVKSGLRFSFNGNEFSLLTYIEIYNLVLYYTYMLLFSRNKPKAKVRK